MSVVDDTAVLKNSGVGWPRRCRRASTARTYADGTSGFVRAKDIVVTDNGEPMVQVISAEAEGLLVRLEREGLLRHARGRRPSAEIVSVRAAGDSATTVSADRDR